MKLVVLLSLLLPALTLAQTPAPTACVDQTQADAFFKDFSVAEYSPKAKNYIEIEKSEDLCDGTSLVNHLIRTVTYLDDMNSYQDPKSPLVVTQQGAGRYFRNRIKNISIEPEGDESCPEGVLAYVYGPEKDVMHVCAGNVKNIDTNLMFGYILVHEARHTEGYGHVLCEHGPYAEMDKKRKGNTSGACDNTLESQGSYGIGVGYLLEVAKKSSDPVEKQTARSNAAVDLVQRFNKMPLDIKVGLVSQSESGDVSFFDGQKRSLLLQLENPETVMALRYDMPVFFDPRGTALSYAYQAELVEASGLYAKKFVTEMSSQERLSLRDVHYGSMEGFSCRLFETKLVCGDNSTADAPDVEVHLVGFKGVQLLMANELRVVGDAGLTYLLPVAWKDFAKWAKSGGNFAQLKNTKNFVTSFVSLNDSHNEDYALIPTGVALMDRKNQKLILQPEYQNEVTKKILGPFYWSKKLEEL